MMLKIKMMMKKHNLFIIKCNNFEKRYTITKYIYKIEQLN
jgi:hypothetical protein